MVNRGQNPEPPPPTRPRRVATHTFFFDSTISDRARAREAELYIPSPSGAPRVATGGVRVAVVFLDAIWASVGCLASVSRLRLARLFALK